MESVYLAAILPPEKIGPFAVGSPVLSELTWEVGKAWPRLRLYDGRTGELVHDRAIKPDDRARTVGRVACEAWTAATGDATWERPDPLPVFERGS